jgi:hypothetical protein
MRTIAQDCIDFFAPSDLGMSARNFSFHLLGRPSAAEYMGPKSEVDFRIKQATVRPINWAEFSGFLFVRQP